MIAAGGFDVVGPDVLVGHRRLDVGDLTAFGETVDDEGVDAVDVRYGDVDHEVIGAGRHEQADGLGQLRRPLAELFDDGTRRRPDPHRDQGLDGAPRGLQIQRRMETRDDSVLTEQPDAFEGGRRRDSCFRCEVAIGLPCIVLQLPQKCPVYRIKFHNFANLPQEV